MTHPSLAELWSDAPPAREHLARCESCRALAMLSSVEAAGLGDGGQGANVLPGEGHAAERDLAELPTVDASMYSDLEQLPDGRGGMGQTFVARDRRLGRVVVIKQLLTASSRGGLDASVRVHLRRRFEREAKLTARLEHPSIVGVHEAGRWPDGELFYAMRFVDGTPLDEEIARRRTLAERLGLLENLTVVADALAYAHGQRIVHRDVKPQNILLGPFGETVLIDWGLAKQLDEVDDSTPASAPSYRDLGGDGLTMMGVGTPQYMPPEQARGAPADERMDIYALGATLYHALGGAPPYGAREPASVRRSLAASPPAPLLEVAPELPAELAAIVDKAMAREPAARFQTARELAQELRRFRSGELTRTYQHGVGDLLRHYARRHKAALRIAAVALAAVVAITGVAFVRVLRERDRADASRRGAEVALSNARGVSASLLARDPLGHLEATELAVLAVAPQLLVGGTPDPGSAARGLYDALSAGPVALALGGQGGVVRAVDVSSDGERVATVADNGAVAFYDVASARELARRSTAVARPSSIALSPSGDAALVGGAEGVELVRADGSSAARIEHESRAFSGALFVGEDGFVTAGAALTAWDAGGRERARIPLAASPRAIATSPRASLVAWASPDGEVRVWRPPDAAARLVGRVPEPVALAFDEAGKHLYIASQAGDLLDAALPRDAAPTDAPTAAPTEIGHLRPSLLAPPLIVGNNGDWIAARDSAQQSSYQSAFVLVRRGKPAMRLGGSLSDGAPFMPELDAVFVTDGEGLSLRSTGGGRLLQVPLGVIAKQPVHVWGPRPGDLHPRLVAAGTTNDRIVLVDARWGAGTGALLGHASEIIGLWPDAGGGRMLSVGVDGEARIWDTRTSAELSRFAAPASILDAAWVPASPGRGPEAVVVACTDGKARVYGAADGAQRLVLGDGAPLVAVAVSPDGGRIATAALDGSVAIRDARSGELVARAPQESPVATSVAFAPDGARLATGHVDQRVRFWDGTTMAALASAGRDGVAGAGAPDVANRASTSNSATAKTVNGADCRDGVASLHYAPDGKILLAGLVCDRTLVVDAASLRSTRTIEGRAAATSSPFAPRGESFALVTMDARILLYATTGGAPRPLHAADQRAVLATAFAPTGAARLATVDAEAAVRIWDLDADPPSATTAWSERNIYAAGAMAFAPDAQRLYIGHMDGELRVYPATVKTALDTACETLAAFARTGEAAAYCASWKSDRSARVR